MCKKVKSVKGKKRKADVGVGSRREMEEERRNRYIDDEEDVEWSTLTPDCIDGVWCLRGAAQRNHWCKYNCRGTHIR